MSQDGFENSFNDGVHFGTEPQPSGGATNPVTGIIGALLGALVGAIPWIVVVYFGWYIGWLAFLIGIASLKGYSIMKGPKNKAFAGAVIWITSLFVIIFMNVVDVAIQLWAEGLPVNRQSIEFVFRYLLKDPSYYASIGISLFIGFIGLVGIGKKINEYVRS